VVVEVAEVVVLGLLGLLHRRVRVWLSEPRKVLFEDHVSLSHRVADPVRRVSRAADVGVGWVHNGGLGFGVDVVVVEVLLEVEADAIREVQQDDREVLFLLGVVGFQQARQT